MKVIEEMNSQELFEFVENYIADKIVVDPDLVRYTYFELKVKLNLDEKKLQTFLKYSKIILEELDYQVYFTGAKFTYKNAYRKVQDNEFMIAIKEEKTFDSQE